MAMDPPRDAAGFGWYSCAEAKKPNEQMTISKAQKRRQRLRRVAVRKSKKATEELLSYCAFIRNAGALNAHALPFYPEQSKYQLDWNSLDSQLDEADVEVSEAPVCLHQGWETCPRRILKDTCTAETLPQISSLGVNSVESGLYGVASPTSSEEEELAKDGLTFDRAKKKKNESPAMSREEVEDELERTNVASGGGWPKASDRDAATFRVCGGPGHIEVCGKCFFKDDRFGRSPRCTRECAVIDGVWRPTRCCPECHPISEECPKSNGGSESHSSSRRIWRGAGKKRDTG